MPLFNPSSGVSLDSTSSDIAPDGVQAAGVNAKAAAADHVHGSHEWQSVYQAPSGALAETYPRMLAVNTSTPTSAVTQWIGIGLPAGLVITNITFLTAGSGESGGSHGWYGIADSTRKYLAVTADKTGATFWAATSAITVALTAPYTTLAAGFFWLVCSVTATGMPSFASMATGGTAEALIQAPILCATGDSQSAPPTVGTTAGALTVAQSSNLYGYVS